MAKRIKKTFARTAPKSQEKRLVENAKKLYENPLLILPECIDEHSKKYFTKKKKILQKINRFRDDTRKLERLAHKKGIEGALAGTLLLALTEKAPYLAVMSFQTGDVVYAQRGKADKEKLVAIQHFDDPVLRLLGIKDLAFKKKWYFYSWNNRFVCTGKEARPPKDFVDFVANKLGFSYKENTVFCQHIDPKAVIKKGLLDRPYLRVHWKSADLFIGICDSCTKTNTIFNISKYMLAPDLSDFEIDVMAKVVNKVKTRYLQEYLSGNLTDRLLIEKNIKAEEERIKHSEEKILVLDGVSYGNNVRKFVEALNPKEHEKLALEFILNKMEEPLIVSKVTPNKVLEMFWNRYGREFIDSVIEDKEMAKSFFSLNDTPSNILASVFEYRERQKILSRLPRYNSLPPLAHFADSIARTYKTFGREKALLEIKKRPDNPKGKSLAYAFLLALGKGKDTKWQFSKEEIEYGEYLREYAKNLLETEPKKYSKSLQELVSACGSSERIP